MPAATRSANPYEVLSAVKMTEASCARAEKISFRILRNSCPVPNGAETNLPSNGAPENLYFLIGRQRPTHYAGPAHGGSSSRPEKGL